MYLIEAIGAQDRIAELEANQNDLDVEECGDDVSLADRMALELAFVGILGAVELADTREQTAQNLIRAIREAGFEIVRWK